MSEEKHAAAGREGVSMTREEMKRRIIDHCANRLGTRLDRFDLETLYTDIADEDFDEFADLAASADLKVEVTFVNG
jgi:hypothetical protein